MSFISKLEKLKALDLPRDQFVVVGSGPLAVRGLRESNDVDVIVTRSLWDVLKNKYSVGTNEMGVDVLSVGEDIEILDPEKSLFSNFAEISAEELFSEADEIEGLKFINLTHLKKIKLAFGREKDFRDIKLIDGYLSTRKS